MSTVPPLILASGSPRRRDLLEEHGYQFTVVKPEVEEIEDPDQSIEQLTRINAKLKADAVSRDHPDAVVMAADTLVLLDGKALGKPVDQGEASAMIRSLNGRTHQVFTAVFIEHQAAGNAEELTVITDVTFKSLSDEELEKYHSLIDPFDKAGAYAAQEHGEIIIEAIEGSMTNVIGLPMDEVNATLRLKFGFDS